ncbi:Glyoxalase-like domain protein [compost metagenome]
MNPVGWFEIPVKDMNRAMSFYQKSLNLEMSMQEMDGVKMAMFPMEEKSAGAAGSLVKSSESKPSHDGSLVYFSVESIEQTLERVRSNGGKVLKPKESIGKYGFIASFEDPEGNRVALHSMH